jgi:hypothetical protein
MTTADDDDEEESRGPEAVEETETITEVDED